MSEDQLQPNYCAEQLKALAEPSRLRIVGALRSGPKTVTELAELLKVEIVTVSHHLGILYNARLVQKCRRGRFIDYSLPVGVFQATGTTCRTDFLELGCCRLEVPKE